ncbi:SIR2 family protein [Achromobacter xylosoxidans]|uniref:SIR2 family protein n=1 Tax=Alcaligenes xylosoxydans xylosoxydans TaxID=85698 RepID=UPI003369C8AB
MIDWSKELIEAIGRRRAVLVIGSGVSKNSQNDAGERPLGWEEFLRRCAVERGDPHDLSVVIGRRDYLMGCQMLKTLMGQESFVRRVQREYQAKGFKAADIHAKLYDLDLPVTISPNFDNIYDDYCRSASNGSYIIKQHSSPDVASYLTEGGVRLLIKSHGSANDPADLIFTASDYSAARTKYRLFYDVLKALALTHTFFLVGCGVDDPDLKMLFEDLRFGHDRLPRHYMTLPQGEVPQSVLDELQRTMPINYILYDPNHGHRELTESLGFLGELVQTSRDSMAKLQSW